MCIRDSSIGARGDQFDRFDGVVGRGNVRPEKRTSKPAARLTGGAIDFRHLFGILRRDLLRRKLCPSRSFNPVRSPGLTPILSTTYMYVPNVLVRWPMHR